MSPSRSTAVGTRAATRRPTPRGRPSIELTIGRHEGGRVSTFLCDHAHPGMVVGIGDVGGAFALDRAARRILFVSGGSGITPVMSMLRTLRAERLRRRDRLRPLRAQRRRGLLRRRTRRHARRSGAARLHPLRRAAIWTATSAADHLDAAMADPDAVYVCGPPALVDAVRAHHPAAAVGKLRPAGVRHCPPNHPAAVCFSPTAGVDRRRRRPARCLSRPRPPD